MPFASHQITIKGIVPGHPLWACCSTKTTQRVSPWVLTVLFIHEDVQCWFLASKRKQKGMQTGRFVSVPCVTQHLYEAPWRTCEQCKEQPHPWFPPCFSLPPMWNQWWGCVSSTHTSVSFGTHVCASWRNGSTGGQCTQGEWSLVSQGSLGRCPWVSFTSPLLDHWATPCSPQNHLL